MQVWLGWLVIGTLLAGVGWAEAAPHTPLPSRKSTAARVSQPFRSLVIEPRAIRLDGPTDRHHLLVFGVRADGSRVDLTDKAVLNTSSPKVAAVEGRAVLARGNGSAGLAARYGGLTARAAISVRNVERPVSYSFQNDVVPVLARLGCSSGTCHGANSGKGGFRLSLRGYAPEQDFITITRQYGGRRISREDPERSLLLRKPLLETPHAGGKVLQKGSREYYTLLGWLQQGAPGVDSQDPRLVDLKLVPGDRTYAPKERQHLLAQARFSDGRLFDVTDRVLFRSNDEGVASVRDDGLVLALSPGETAVQAKYMDQLAVVRVTVPYRQKVRPAAFKAPHNYVDTLVYQKLRALNLEPSPLCSDEEFVRRVYLDVAGTLPTAEEARRFLDSRDPRKREKLIDEVLQRPEYASIWALKICDLSMVRKEHMQRKYTLALHQWLTTQFLENRPWDRIVTDLVTASGSKRDNPATLWWASRQQTRPNSRGWVRHYELTGEIVSQVFLGQRIQCAKCHNHPTERYTQDDYYHFAAIFAQVNGDRTVYDDPVPLHFLPNDPGEVRHPRTNEVVEARPLDRSPLSVAKDEDRRIRFAEWMTKGAGKELFSRNIVNRMWARLFGQGLVDPVDDLRATNPPRNEALLDALARDLIAHGYDLKYLMKTILLSRTYQTTSAATPKNKIDTQFFSHYPVRRIQGEELLDAIAQVTGVPDRYVQYPLGTRAIELSDIEIPSAALDTFGRPTRVTPCECDRSSAPSLSQALALFNGPALQEKLKHQEGTVARLLASGKSDAALVEELFLSAFARRPSPDEAAAVSKAIAQAPAREEALQDVLWALINSKEFMFHH